MGARGRDTRGAWVRERRCRLCDYFTQQFAQVTNPPLDAIREEQVTSMQTTLGPEGNLLEPTPAACRQIVLPSPIISNEELAKPLYINDNGDMPGFKPFAHPALHPVPPGAHNPEEATGGK